MAARVAPGQGCSLSRVKLLATNICSQAMRRPSGSRGAEAAAGLARVSYFLATTIVLTVAVTFSTTSTTTM
jgi:hypothetical protein